MTYCNDKVSKHVRTMSDNTTAISYVNNKGVIKSELCNDITKETMSLVYIIKVLDFWCTHLRNKKT